MGEWVAVLQRAAPQLCPTMTRVAAHSLPHTSLLFAAAKVPMPSSAPQAVMASPISAPPTNQHSDPPKPDGNYDETNGGGGLLRSVIGGGLLRSVWGAPVPPP